MKLKIDPEIFEKFPDLCIGVVVCKDLKNEGMPEEVQKEIREQEKLIRAAYRTETLSQTPKIAAWRNAYSVFGGHPKDNKSSVENLYRLILKGTELRHINKLVDVYNLVSLKHTVPVGGEDTDKIQGDVVLTFAGADEPPVLLLGDKEPRPPHAGEIIYKDDVSAICRRWNWREADRTKFTENTRNCLLVIEGIPPVTRRETETAAKELQQLVEKFCGGKTSTRILHTDDRETEI